MPVLSWGKGVSAQDRISVAEEFPRSRCCIVKDRRSVGACGDRASVRHLEISVQFSAGALYLYHNKG